jgi:hypothetical protein
MDPHVAMTIDKLPDPGGAMGREIICNNVDLLALGKAGHDLFKESSKLRTGVTRRGLAQHLACLGVERGVERKRAVTVILKTVSLGSSGREQQDWIEAVQSLDGALFVDAKDGRVDWRLQIQANDVSSLGFKIWVVAGHVAAKPVGLQSGFGQNTGYSRMIGAKFGRQLPSTPVRRAILGLLSGGRQNLTFELGGLLAGYLATMATEKTGQALVHKAFEPKSHRVDAASQLPTYRPLRPAASNQGASETLPESGSPLRWRRLSHQIGSQSEAICSESQVHAVQESYSQPEVGFRSNDRFAPW